MEATENNLTSAPPLHFDAVLRPHRSLNATGFKWLIGVLAVLSLIPGAIFFFMGAWPVPGFLGLDLLLIYIAFRINYRRARAYEAVQLSRESLTVTRVDARGRRQCHSFEPYWVRVEMDDPPEHDSVVTLTSHGRRFSFAHFLSPEERLDFANALDRALYRLKHSSAEA